MDNQKHKNLEKLYKYLCNNNQSCIADISTNLNIQSQNIPDLISELNLMGLNITQESSQVKLTNHNLDTYDLNEIIKFTKHNPKQIVYNFITTSTNLQAQENQKDCIYITDFQSKGKGRQAKKWLTPVGQSIALSISHRFKFGLQNLSGLNIVIGVAIIQTLNQFGKNNIGLKWPNDVINSQGKIAGILIEATGNSSTCRAIIGIGLNWNIRQELFKNIDQPCSNAKITSTTRTQFITALIISINTLLTEFKQNKLHNIKPIWEMYDTYLNKNINIIQGETQKSATYKGINSTGLLKVEIANKLITVASGEVSIKATNMHTDTN